MTDADRDEARAVKARARRNIVRYIRVLWRLLKTAENILSGLTDAATAYLAANGVEHLEDEDEG